MGLNCSPQFDYDYLELSLSDPLPPGNYSLGITKRNGSKYADAILRKADAWRVITSNFTVTDIQPRLDSLIPPACEPNTLHLFFSDPVKCSSIAADGSDFIVTGSSAVTIMQATGGHCSGNLTNQIDITLSSPIMTEGSYQIAVANGSDGNTLTNQCDNAMAAGSSLPFKIGTPFLRLLIIPLLMDAIRIQFN